MDALLSSELSAETLAALQAHLAAVQVRDEDDDVSEDFRLSQFWYDQKTGDALALEALEKSKGGPIAFLSTPAAFKALKAMEPERDNVYLFEYDHRFGDKYGDAFAFYDYNNPLDVDTKFHHFFDYVLVEPPYLTSQCLRGFAKTMRLISREVDIVDGVEVLKTPNTFINSGAMHKVMLNELKLVPSGFVPTFESKLSNRLTTYINYESERFGPCDHTFDDDVEE
ncbi:hypothetical protein, variant 2 [Saprolegnia diclina VS20]|nr:hypothetical protein, variant 2 [Saprolegnia diclina VS20]XP_008618827.1 hypothetical protein, variant 1 [Saprolegnia diclina VS20]EQC27721.1 hypothetical protein, variant 1 [Saprolegnia diclina VS20]EQC27722.1 hypothetical protein, variant 2 [Saprolegnia diclina VS20]|eukprot:XP_008618826.1 hypothetical protein, variant 2 [Saprolegnia diclina VS20]